MPMCVIVTRDVENRYRGFLGSVMLEVAPGVYSHPRLNKRVREQVWSVLEDWHGQLQRGSVVMTWADNNAASASGLLTLGEPAKQIVEHEGMLLVRRSFPESDKERSAD